LPVRAMWTEFRDDLGGQVALRAEPRRESFDLRLDDPPHDAVSEKVAGDGHPHPPPAVSTRDRLRGTHPWRRLGRDAVSLLEPTGLVVTAVDQSLVRIAHVGQAHCRSRRLSSPPALRLLFGPLR